MVFFQTVLLKFVYKIAGDIIMKKHIPNIISSLRIAAAASLFFFTTISTSFLSIYLFCGFTDFIDGTLARKLDAASMLGAKLDTAGDVITYFSLAKILIFHNLVPLWIILWMGAALLGFLISAVIAKKRFGKFYFVHSLFGKILGVSLFCLPFMISLISEKAGLSVVCIIASIAAIESIIIQSKSKSAHLDVLSLKNLKN